MKQQDFKIEFQKGTLIEQIEKASVILANIFGVLRSNAEFPENSEKFQDETVSLSQIGEALVYSIYENVSNFIEPDENKEFTDTDNLLNTSQLIETENLAVSLSQILNNPAMPITLYNSLQNAIAEAYSGGNGEVLNQFESSPEFMKAVIDSCKNDES
jgi:hypothetical protein